MANNGLGAQGIGSSCVSRKEESGSKTRGGDVISINMESTGLGGHILMALHDKAPKNYAIGINQTGKWLSKEEMRREKGWVLGAVDFRKLLLRRKHHSQPLFLESENLKMVGTWVQKED